MPCDVDDPSIAIFNAIEGLYNLATQQQIINYGTDILKNTGEFDTSLTTWFNCPPATHQGKFQKTLYASSHKLDPNLRNLTTKYTVPSSKSSYPKTNQGIFRNEIRSLRWCKCTDCKTQRTIQHYTWFGITFFRIITH